MAITVGERLPRVIVKTMSANGAQDIIIPDIFKDKRAILFAVPGAFTPTCSNKHLPGYLENKQKLNSHGIQMIACLSVNDVFVMDAWGKDHQVGEDIVMLADGNAEFTKSIGLIYDATQSGMGIRSLRYSMLIDNGIVERLFVDQPKQYKTSNVESVLEYLRQEK